MRIDITTSATFKSKTYVAGATKANMSGAITGDTPEAFVEALHDVNDNHAKDDIESALDYISDAKHEFVEELKRQFSTLEALEPEIIDFCPRYDVCRDAVKVILAGYDCVEVTSKMYLNVTLDSTVKHINQDTANELAKLLSTIKSQIEDTVNYIETRYHISIKYAVDIA
jgi:hypothetical protein